MKELTKAEEQVMQVLWELKQGFVKDLLPHFPDPKPAYNTVSTIIRILEKKGVVSYKSYGKSHQYYPIVSKEEYTKQYFGKFMKDYFSDSFSKMVNFFSKQNDLTVSELDEIVKMLKNIKKKKLQYLYSSFC